LEMGELRAGCCVALKRSEILGLGKSEEDY
jgi:hypothetical protein